MRKLADAYDEYANAYETLASSEPFNLLSDCPFFGYARGESAKLRSTAQQIDKKVARFIAGVTEPVTQRAQTEE